MNYCIPNLNYLICWACLQVIHYNLMLTKYWCNVSQNLRPVLFEGFTDSHEAFYIYLNVGERLVVSGSEDGLARAWDRSTTVLDSCPFFYHLTHYVLHTAW